MMLNAAPAAAGGASATLKGAFDDFQSKGWGQLNPEQKRKLITAGVVTAAGYRVATGRDPLSGDKN